MARDTGSPRIRRRADRKGFELTTGFGTLQKARITPNIDTTRPNLSYLDLAGTVLEQGEPDLNLLRTSIRHLDLRADRRLAFAMQWEGAEGARHRCAAFTGATTHRCSQKPLARANHIVALR